MSIAIMRKDGVCCPIVLCDHCGQRIACVEDGNYEWEMEQEMAPVIFTHKRCSTPYRREHPEVLMAWDTLASLLIRLETNTSMTPAKRTREKILMEMFA